MNEWKREIPARFFNLLILAGFMLPTLAARAQTSGAISASSMCERSILHQTANVGDGGHHTISLDQRVCSWSRPFTIAGARGKHYTATGVDDVQFNRSSDQGYAVGTMEDGDNYFLRYQGTAVMKGPVPVHLEGRWRFTGGTGRLAGLKGSGTYGARPTPDGRMVFTIKGNYALPSRLPK